MPTLIPVSRKDIRMILPLSNGISPVKNIPKTNTTAVVSFCKNINNTDEFDIDDTCNDELTAIIFSRSNVQLIGKLDGKDYNIRFEQKDAKNKKLIDIKGYYNNKEVDIKANYKNNKHHYFEGTFNNEFFDIEHRVGGLFTSDKLTGKIDNKNFFAKFPTASATDKHKDLIILLLHLSGYITSIEGHNFSVTEPSDFSYAYFNGRCDTRPAGGTLLDDIWKDPIVGPACV